MQITGVELLINVLKSEGVDKLFAYPGGQVIPTFDGLYRQEGIEIILPRHEQALVHAADGYARSTGKVGVCLVTSGPGATNAVTGIATANYDSVPMVCLTGQVPTKIIGNDAFQEVDIVGITRSISKHSVTVTNRGDLGRILKEAFYIARSGRPGPVVVDLPIDIMEAVGSDSFPTTVGLRSYKPSQNVHQGQLKKAVNALMEAKRPLFLAGGGINIARANEEFTELVEKTRVPVVSTIMGKGAIDTTHELYVGCLGMHGSYAANNAIMDCDVLFSIGTRFNDRIAGNVEEFAPHAKIIHIDIDPASISRNIVVDIPIVGDAKKAVVSMLKSVHELPTEDWVNQIKGWKKEYPLQIQNECGVSPRAVFDLVNQEFDNSVVVTDVGQHQMWAAQYVDITKNKQFITSGGLGTMGFGLPAAIGAQIGNPDRKVICISGDGGFQMNSQELATAVIQELPVIVFIMNNGYLGMVRQWQDLFHDKRYSATCLRRRKSCDGNCGRDGFECPPYSPDFMKLADAYGCKGYRVHNDEELVEAVAEAKKSTSVPVLIEVMIERELNVMPMVKGGDALNKMMMEG